MLTRWQRKLSATDKILQFMHIIFCLLIVYDEMHIVFQLIKDYRTGMKCRLWYSWTNATFKKRPYSFLKARQHTCDTSGIVGIYGRR